VTWGILLLVWLLVTMGVAFGSALLPLISIEMFVIGLCVQRPEIPWVAIGAVVAIGQLAGKLPYYYAARGDLRLPDFLHRTPKPVDPDKPPGRWARIKARWQPALDRLRDRCHHHPRWMMGATAVSSVVGVPPFMATTVLAGLTGVTLRWFLVLTVPGRFVRFCVLAASPGLLMGGLV
jgi:membrane protein YqaA with SNARE-associated domain